MKKITKNVGGERLLALSILELQKYRTSICKLRVSSYRLEIETGRWAKPNKIPLENRLYMICNVLED